MGSHTDHGNYGNTPHDRATSATTSWVTQWSTSKLTTTKWVTEFLTSWLTGESKVTAVGTLYVTSKTTITVYSTEVPKYQP